MGFFRFSPATADALADLADWYRAQAPALEYEEAIRDLMLAEPDRFGVEYVTDLWWTEIDFPRDVLRAREVILPKLEGARRGAYRPARPEASRMEPISLVTRHEERAPRPRQ